MKQSALSLIIVINLVTLPVPAMAEYTVGQLMGVCLSTAAPAERNYCDTYLKGIYDGLAQGLIKACLDTCPKDGKHEFGATGDRPRVADIFVNHFLKNADQLHLPMQLGGPWALWNEAKPICKKKPLTQGIVVSTKPTQKI